MAFPESGRTGRHEREPIMSRALLVIDVQNECLTGALPITHPAGHKGQILKVMDAAAGRTDGRHPAPFRGPADLPQGQPGVGASPRGRGPASGPAQADDYEQALAEIRAGRKRSHWMWYIFPQIEGL